MLSEFETYEAGFEEPDGGELYAELEEEDAAFDDEGEELFIGRLVSIGRRALRTIRRSPRLSALAKGLVTGGAGAGGIALGQWLDRRSGRGAGRSLTPWAGLAGTTAGGLLGNLIFADEEMDLDEAEDADEIAAQMEEFGYLASVTEDDEEAEAFIGALVPLAARLIPRAASVLSKVTPVLSKGAALVARSLRGSPATRKLVRTLPTVVRQAARQVVGQAVRGRRPTRRQAARTITRQAVRVVASPRRTALALGRSQILVRQLAARNRQLELKILHARRALA